MREGVKERATKISGLGWAGEKKVLEEARAIEAGRVVARDIGGSDPERMAAPRVEEYVEEAFKGTKVKVEVTLTRHKPPPHVHPSQVSSEKTRQVNSDPQLGFVNAHGYISLFPFLLQLLSPDSDKLGIILTSLTNPDLLYTPYGLRSLSKNSPLYMKKNTEHDAPYWRGPIWININFLAIRSLHHYSKVEGPPQSLAGE